MRILVVYYSLYGHVMQMARAAEKGARAVPGAEVVVRRIAEFPDIEAEIQKGEHSRKVWEQHKAVPVCTLEDLKSADGVVFGSPTRYGNMIAQAKRLVDSTGGLWMEGAMEGKPIGFITSTATTHGGQESTILTMMVPFLHLGMVMVGVPYSTPGMLHTEGRGGTPYGATTVAGSRNELLPKPEDLAISEFLGKRVAEMAKKLRG